MRATLGLEPFDRLTECPLCGPEFSTKACCIPGAAVYAKVAILPNPDNVCADRRVTRRAADLARWSFRLGKWACGIESGVSQGEAELGPGPNT